LFVLLSPPGKPPSSFSLLIWGISISFSPLVFFLYFPPSSSFFDAQCAFSSFDLMENQTTTPPLSPSYPPSSPPHPFLLPPAAIVRKNNVGIRLRIHHSSSSGLRFLSHVLAHVPRTSHVNKLELIFPPLMLGAFSSTTALCPFLSSPYSPRKRVEETRHFRGF